MSLFTWIESSAIGRFVGESLWVTASLSAVHILAFTLVMGSALLVNLRLLDTLLVRRPLREVTRPASRAIALGLAISLVTGFLLFSPRAVSVAESSTFQTKMLLLIAAVVFHFVFHGRVTRRPKSGALALRTIGGCGLILWMGLAVAACWFILFE